jgi:hypothetical protein
VVQRDVGVSLVLDLLFGRLDLADEEVHNLDSFLLDTGLDGVPFGEVVEGLQHVYSLLDSGHLLEGEVDDVLVHYVQFFHASLESVVLLVPVRSLHVQDLLLLV